MTANAERRKSSQTHYSSAEHRPFFIGSLLSTCEVIRPSTSATSPSRLAQLVPLTLSLLPHLSSSSRFKTRKINRLQHTSTG